MNSKFKTIFFTLVSLLVFLVAACPASAQTLNSPEALKEYLDKQPANTPDKPIMVSMGANDLMLRRIVFVLMTTGKYVSLNLTGNALTTIPDYAFQECFTLTAITIPNSVTTIGYNVFYGCTNLSSITIPNRVTSILGSAFQGCTSLSSVTIPSSVTKIVHYAFWDCTSLTSVTFQGTVNIFGNASENAFDGDLFAKFYVTDASNGTPGTYTTSAPVTSSSVWTLQH